MEDGPPDACGTGETKQTYQREQAGARLRHSRGGHTRDGHVVQPDVSGIVVNGAPVVSQ